jgi:hypothetical protein
MRGSRPVTAYAVIKAMGEAMKKPDRTAVQRVEEEAIRRQHAINPIRQRLE